MGISPIYVIAKYMLMHRTAIVSINPVILAALENIRTQNDILAYEKGRIRLVEIIHRIVGLYITMVMNVSHVMWCNQYFDRVYFSKLTMSRNIISRP